MVKDDIYTRQARDKWQMINEYLDSKLDVDEKEDLLKPYRKTLLKYVNEYGVERVFEKPLFVTLVLDDCQDTNAANKAANNPFFSISRRNRHLLVNVWVLFHSVKDGLKRSIRVNISRNFFHKFTDEDSIKDIYELSFSAFCTYKVFELFYKKFFDNPNNFFIQIDNDTGESRENWGKIYHDPIEMILDYLTKENGEEGKEMREDMREKNSKRRIEEIGEKEKDIKRRK